MTKKTSVETQSHPSVDDRERMVEVRVLLPGDVVRRMDINRTLVGQTRQAFVQLARAEHGEHHELIEIGSAALDSDLLANGGMRTIAADDLVGFKYLMPGSVSLHDGHPRLIVVLRDIIRRPSKADFNGIQARQPGA